MDIFSFLQTRNFSVSGVELCLSVEVRPGPITVRVKSVLKHGICPLSWVRTVCFLMSKQSIWALLGLLLPVAHRLWRLGQLVLFEGLVSWGSSLVSYQLSAPWRLPGALTSGLGPPFYKCLRSVVLRRAKRGVGYFVNDIWHLPLTLQSLFLYSIIWLSQLHWEGSKIPH